jgi:predicted dinucleotide-binding enzyme
MAEPQHIAVIGVGKVGAPLASRLARAGHHVVVGESRPGSESARRAVARDDRLSVRSVEEAVEGADVVFLATPFAAVEDVLAPLAPRLDGKVVVDCTNPVGPNLSHLFASTKSGSSVVQALAPTAQVVKAFTVYGFENFEDPSYPGYDVRPAMPICGDSPSAKATVARIVDDCGFEPLDVGSLAQAVHLEHMTLLWIRMVRVERLVPDLTWAALRRHTDQS